MASPWAGGGDAFGRIELWLWGALAGVLFRAPGTWLGFWTINHTGVQTYLIALTAMPFFAIALEASAAYLGWVTPPRLSAGEWAAAAIILAASVWLIVVRMTPARVDSSRHRACAGSGDRRADGTQARLDSAAGSALQEARRSGGPIRALSRGWPAAVPSAAARARCAPRPAPSRNAGAPRPRPSSARNTPRAASP